MEKSSAEKRVVTRAATMWKSRVSAIIRLVRLRFGILRREMPLTSPVENDSLRRRAR
jgi:hypothetical protein